MKKIMVTVKDISIGREITSLRDSVQLQGKDYIEYGTIGDKFVFIPVDLSAVNETTPSIIVSRSMADLIVTKEELDRLRE
jgi:hypothetical protein